jgi:hypothetical protein
LLHHLCLLGIKIWKLTVLTSKLFCELLLLFATPTALSPFFHIAPKLILTDDITLLFHCQCSSVELENKERHSVYVKSNVMCTVFCMLYHTNYHSDAFRQSVMHSSGSLVDYCIFFTARSYVDLKKAMLEWLARHFIRTPLMWDDHLNVLWRNYNKNSLKMASLDVETR